MTIGEWIEQARASCLREAFEFLRLKGLCDAPEELNALAAEWPRHIAERFDAGAPDSFYAQWTGRTGASSIVINIWDQFSRDYVVAALFYVFGPPYTFAGRLLDFGCGTAAISLTWQRQFAPRSRLYLADVDNLPAEFVRYRIESQGDTGAIPVGVLLEELSDNALDVVLCIDVLEHLQRPSDTFRLLDRKIRGGGFLILQAPWGNHPEHLDAAPLDWASNGGGEMLDTHYLPLLRMSPGAYPSGVFVKKLMGT